jgi:serine/threonine-protein kinase
MSNAPPRLGTGNLQSSTLLNNRYEVVGKIAQGGMGAVYLVRDTRLNKKWAMKEMSQRTFTPDQLQNAVNMFQSEAQILAQLQHANLPMVVDLFTFQTTHYLVMDYIEGETLEAVLKRNKAPFSLHEVMRYARQLIGVLSFLHNQNPPIVYLDLKPANIMLQPNGLIKLIDFGICRFQRKRTSRNLLVPGLSENDVGIGTPGYAAPEQWRIGNITVQADIYSLGVTLHQFLTYYDPTTTPFVLPSILSLNPNVPVPIAGVIAQAHELELAKRCKTMLDFERAWEQALLGSSGVMARA